MKTSLLSAMVLGALLFQSESKAQLSFGLQVNIGARPAAVAAERYEGSYYYLPEIDVYYDIIGRRYIYMENNRWVYSSELPGAFRGYDVSRAYKVVINEYKPYLHGEDFRVKYRGYYDNYNRRPEAANRQYDGGYDKQRYAYRDYSQERNDNRGQRYDYRDYNQQRSDNRGQERNDSRYEDRPVQKRYTPGFNDNNYEQRSMQRNERFEGNATGPKDQRDAGRNNENNNGYDRGGAGNGNGYGSSNGYGGQGRFEEGNAGQKNGGENNGGQTSRGQFNGGQNNNYRQDEQKNEERNGRVGENGNNGAVKEAPKTPVPVPGAGQGNSRGDAQQQFYNNGQSRDAVRNPKFTAPSQPADKQSGNQGGKDSSHATPPVKGTSGTDNTNTRRNDHIVMNTHAQRNF